MGSYYGYTPTLIHAGVGSIIARGAEVVANITMEGAKAIAGIHMEGAKTQAGMKIEGAKTRVTCYIRTTLLYSDGDFLTDLGEDAGHMTPSLEFSFLSKLKRASHNYLASILPIYLSMS